MKTKKELNIATLMPVIIFAVITLLFGILTKGQIFRTNNLMNIVNQSVPYFLAGMGMLFVVAMGGTDITCGSIIGLAGTAAAWAALNIGTWAMFPAAIILGTVIGFVNGIIVSKFKVSSFMCTLAMLLAMRACVNWWLQATVYHCNDSMKVFDELGVKMPILIVVIGIFAYIFRFTPFGKYTRAIGENENAMNFTGVSVLGTKVLAFTLSGLLAGIAGVFVVIRLGGASNTMGAGMEMKVMLCMFLASIPVEGGSGTAVYKMLIGTLTYFMLDNGLTLLGGTSDFNQMIRGIVLILALFITRVAIEAGNKKNIKKAFEEEAVKNI